MVSFDRRAVIAGALSTGALAAVGLPELARAAVAAAAPAAAPANALLRFNVLRNGKPFGNYQVAFVSSGDLLTVTTDVAMAARVAGLTVFNYRHHCQEVWKAGRFMELHSNSVRDHDQETLAAVRTDSGIAITAKDGLLKAPINANPLTHWNAAVLQGPMFNPQTGLMLRLTSQTEGHEAVTLANGAKVNATHWALRGESEIDEWYDDSGSWAGLRAVFPDKSIVEYRRV